MGNNLNTTNFVVTEHMHSNTQQQRLKMAFNGLDNANVAILGNSRKA